MAKNKKNLNSKKVSENYLTSIPLVAKENKWHEKEEGIIEIDMEHKGFYAAIAQRFFKKPKVSHVALDRYGSRLWKLIDGNNTVLDIVSEMEKSFPNEKDRMLDRVVTFMATLQSNNFIEMKGANK